MHKDILDSIAHGRALGLGVVDDIHRHVNVCTLVNINVAVALPGLDNRNSRIIYDSADKSAAAARNKQVDVLIQLHHRVCYFA